MNSSTLTIPGLCIAYKTWGNPHNPTILALHGWLDNANSFDQIAEYMQEHFYIIAIDLPGHGHSSHLPEGSNYHFIDGIFTIKRILQGFQLDKVHLLGHSLGACLASLVAGLLPENILSMGLLEGLGPLTKPAETAHKQLSEYINTLLLDKQKSAKGYPSFADAAKARAQKGYVSLEIAQKLCERSVIEKDGIFYWRHDKRLIYSSPLQMTEVQVLSCLKKIQAKTFLLWANQGFSLNSELVQERVNAVQNLTVQHLDGGHHIHMEQPEAVAQLLVDFYRR